MSPDPEIDEASVAAVPPAGYWRFVQSGRAIRWLSRNDGMALGPSLRLGLQSEFASPDLSIAAGRRNRRTGQPTEGYLAVVDSPLTVAPGTIPRSANQPFFISRA